MYFNSDPRSPESAQTMRLRAPSTSPLHITCGSQGVSLLLVTRSCPTQFSPLTPLANHLLQRFTELGAAHTYSSWFIMKECPGQALRRGTSKCKGFYPRGDGCTTLLPHGCVHQPRSSPHPRAQGFSWMFHPAGRIHELSFSTQPLSPPQWMEWAGG